MMRARRRFQHRANFIGKLREPTRSNWRLIGLRRDVVRIINALQRSNPCQHILGGHSIARAQCFPFAWHTNHAHARPTRIIARQKGRQRHISRPTPQHIQWLQIPVQALSSRHAVMLGISSQFDLIVRKNPKSISLQVRGVSRIYSVQLTQIRGSSCRLPHHHVPVPVFKKNQADQLSK